MTEAIWEHMPGERGLLMLAPLPAPDAAHRDADAERDMGRAIEIVTAVRADPTTAIEMPDGFAGAGIVAQLAPKRAADGEVPDRAALERELAKLRAERDRAEGMLGNERFTSKAPPEVVAAEEIGVLESHGVSTVDDLVRFAAEVQALESRLAALE